MTRESSPCSTKRRLAGAFTSKSVKRRLTGAFSAVVLLFVVIGIYTGHDSMEIANMRLNSQSATTRKLLNHVVGNEEGNGNMTMVDQPDRIWTERCSKSDIMVSQGDKESLPNGIPSFTVNIMNMCASGCDISGIHLSCGWFISARLVNPRIMKQVRFDDCIVNEGKPLAYGATLSFQYANTFRYPLSVSSVRC